MTHVLVYKGRSVDKNEESLHEYTTLDQDWIVHNFQWYIVTSGIVIATDQVSGMDKWHTQVTHFHLTLFYSVIWLGVVLGVLVPPWVAIQASRCAGRVDRILAVKNPGVSLRHSYENGGREVSPGMIAVLLQDIPREKGSLLIRYPDLIRTMYWSSLVGI